MAEQQPPDAPDSVDPPPAAVTSAVSLPASSAYPTENLNNVASVSKPAYSGGGGLASKRQRRPSVRLGEIGDQSFDQARPNSRRPKTAYRFHKDPSLAAKTSKTRPLTNLVNGAGAFAYHHNQEEKNSFAYEFGSRKPATKKPTKKARTNWASSSKYEAAASNGGGIIENDSTFRAENHENDDFREVEAEVSDSPMKERSPVQSEDNQNMGLHFWDRRATRARGSRSESDNIHNINSNQNNAVDGFQDINSGDENRCGGVRNWLNSLGLGRYAPVFEIHEVDDEVLPMLTLEDLKDMGINAVGSRRRMYAGILKLREGFS